MPDRLQVQESELARFWRTFRVALDPTGAALADVRAERDRYRVALEAVRYEIEGDSEWTADRWGDAALEALQVIREALDG